MGGGQDNPAGLSSPPGGKINQPGYVAPPGVKITRVGGRISRDRLPPGGQPIHGWLAPRRATCPGGKINWDTGITHKNIERFERFDMQKRAAAPSCCFSAG